MNRSTVVKLCNSLDIEIDDDSNSREFNVRLYAPKGRLFGCTKTHSLANHQYKGFGAVAVRQFWSSIADDITYGLETCDVADCDVCNEE